jgi:hypothetical protein
MIEGMRQETLLAILRQERVHIYTGTREAVLRLKHPYQRDDTDAIMADTCYAKSGVMGMMKTKHKINRPSNRL